jgi:hypothetical protein
MPFRLVTEWRIIKRVEEQFQAVMKGFLEVVPAQLISVFDERELELLIGGMADIDIEDWKKHTEYKGYSADDITIQWFWKVRHFYRFHWFPVLICSALYRLIARRKHGYCSS